MTQENVGYEKRAHHKRTLNGADISYETICEDLPVTDENGEVLGTAFAYEYIREDVTDKQTRPVLFAWNGGPGSSAVWLHAGFLAPLRFQIEDIKHPEFIGNVPLEENPACLLEDWDIVILDPPGTGYGTVTSGADTRKLFGYEADAKCMAQVVESWLLREERLHCPVYLLGESYGTIRNCLVADILAGGPLIPGMKSKALKVAGVIMMGSAVNADPFLWEVFGEKNVSAQALAIPTMAAIHWYHTPEENRTETLEERVNRAYAFASDRYVRAAYLGNRMSAEERAEIVKEMSDLIGIRESYLRNHGLVIDNGTFQKVLLEEEGKMVSAYDGRMTLVYTEGSLDPYADDGVLGPFGMIARNAFDQICKTELEIDLKRSFSCVDFAVNGAWNYKHTATPFASLSRCLRRDASFRVFFANGVYDMTTMIGQASYAAGQIRTAKEGQVLVKEYPSGHMAYIGKKSAKMLKEDLEAFIKSCKGGRNHEI